MLAALLAALASTAGSAGAARPWCTALAYADDQSGPNAVLVSFSCSRALRDARVVLPGRVQGKATLKLRRSTKLCAVERAVVSCKLPAKPRALAAALRAKITPAPGVGKPVAFRATLDSGVKISLRLQLIELPGDDD
jgi:hypothetical protein